MVYDWFTMFLQGRGLPVLRRWSHGCRPEADTSDKRAPLILSLAALETGLAAELAPTGCAIIIEAKVEAIEQASTALAACLPDAVLLAHATPVAVQRLHVALGVMEAKAGVAQGRTAILAQLGADPAVFLGGARFKDLSTRLVALVFGGAQLRQRLSGPAAARPEEEKSFHDKGLEALVRSDSRQSWRGSLPAPDRETPLFPIAFAEAQTLLMAADAGLAALLQAPPGSDDGALAAQAEAARLAGFRGLVL
ncbi:hypothetical protein BTR14_00245 [Rhizobium rhizosphaerae]|uniref:Uncharacterized protein n=1 Tax=Xaviernesmea rhizosphaerae TaxID=1672749 RepID=A0ABX3PHM8_9HYPH|nr:hypothetical protein [Xaviernesmea rhizosphaerae]OQP87958.1 hypothetical protein BTR14_00245 [Xaviernesmea rhizosphaerae]